MPLKPTKRGIKVWVAADCTNGYFARFEVYTRKKSKTTEHGLGARVVKIQSCLFLTTSSPASNLEDLEKDLWHCKDRSQGIS